MTTEPSAGLPSIPSGTFRIDREGVWHHEGQEITHPGVLDNLYANLRVDASGHFLQVGPTRIPIAVEDTPFVVVRLEIEPPAGDQPPAALRLRLTDGTDDTLPAVPGCIWLGPRDTPYCRVKAGRFTARIGLAAWLQLADRLEEDAAAGVPVLVVGGRRLRLERRA